MPASRDAGARTFSKQLTHLRRYLAAAVRRVAARLEGLPGG